MNVLHVNTYDLSGGAARAAMRLHLSLLESGVDSKMIVQNKTSQLNSVFTQESKFYKLFNKFKPYLDAFFVKKYQSNSLFSPSCLYSNNIINQINRETPDLVHLHWVCNGMLKIEDIKKINAPIVWTLHDNWAYTGGCHVVGDCDKYRSGCGKCPVLNSNVKKDLSYKVFKRKQNSFNKIEQLHIVSLSQWMLDNVLKSNIFSGRDVTVLPNPLDSTIFRPMNKVQARTILGLPLDKKLVLYGALSATTDLRKGFSELQQALKELHEVNLELVVFGEGQNCKGKVQGFDAHFFGKLYDDVSLTLLYSACDVMVVPSREEAFGQTASEALSCGTPVVAFNHTGLKEIVDHKVNGYLAQPMDVHDLSKGILWVIEHPKPYTLSENARLKVITSFDSKVVSKKYMALYESVLSKTRN